MLAAGAPRALYLGGGRVELRPGDATTEQALGAFAARVQPFLTPHRPPGFEPPAWSIRVGLRCAAPDALRPQFDADLRYGRFDLGFAARADRRMATAVFDGDPGGLFAVLELAVYAALGRAGGLLLHATAAVLDGDGWVLPGPSGTGKSTAARGGGFDRVLTDERAIARCSGDRWWVFGTPWWSRGRSLPLDPGAVLLTDLIRLHQAADPERGARARDLAPDEAAAWLLGSVALYETTSDARRASFDQACALVEAVRCRAVWFPREGAWSRSIKTG